MKFIMACDESGAKGYADQDEQYAGQVGVFAGILVPEVILAQTERDIEAVIAPHRSINGKLHITDLEGPAQPILRANVFDAIRALRLPCFWYAIHVAGFHCHYVTMTRLLEGTGSQTPTQGSGVKSGSPRNQPDSLHVELFRALYGHMIAFIEERSPGDVVIEARTDRVDTPIAKSFRREADRLLETSRKSIVTGYDRENQQVVKRELRFGTHFPPELQIATKVKSLDLKIVSDSDPIVMAADILANSLYHHFRSRSGGQLYADLNRPDAVAEHPLAANLDAFRNWGRPDLVGDRMFRHPRAGPAPL